MKFKTLVEGLSNIINDFVEEKLDPETEEKFKKYLNENIDLASFVKKSREGKKALQNRYEVKAADDFEEKMTDYIAALNEEQDQTGEAAI